MVNEQRHLGMLDECLGGRAKKEFGDGRHTIRTHDDETGFKFVGLIHDDVSGRCRRRNGMGMALNLMVMQERCGCFDFLAGGFMIGIDREHMNVMNLGQTDCLEQL